MRIKHPGELEKAFQKESLNSDSQQFINTNKAITFHLN
jgi:hypothetical protein